MKEKLLIPQDKGNHLIYGLLIFLVINLFVTDYQALLITFLIALVSEYRDRHVTEKFDFKDVLCSIILPIIIILNNQLNQ